MKRDKAFIVSEVFIKSKINNFLFHSGCMMKMSDRICLTTKYSKDNTRTQREIIVISCFVVKPTFR